MAVDKVAVFPSFMTSLNSRISLEDTLARFDEQMAKYTPDVIRKRLRKKISDIKVNISTQKE